MIQVWLKKVFRNDEKLKLKILKALITEFNIVNGRLKQAFLLEMYDVHTPRFRKKTSTLS